jgi:maleate isomerase
MAEGPGAHEVAEARLAAACVQMPSLPAVPVVEKELGLPVLTAATASVHQVLTRLGLSTRIPDAGALLA